MRILVALALCSGLIACTDNPDNNRLGQVFFGLPSASPEIGITSVNEKLPPDYADFNQTGAMAAHANATCTQGFEKTGEQTLEGEPVGLVNTKGVCATYVPLLGHNPFGDWVEAEAVPEAEAKAE